MHSVAETSVFSRQVDALLNEGDRVALIDRIAADPMAGDWCPAWVASESCGLLPRAGKSQVRSGSCYTLRPVLALLIYGKNRQENITPAQQTALLRLIATEKTSRRGTK